MENYKNARSKSTAFSDANKLFKKLEVALHSKEMISGEHDEIESHIKKEGFEVMRLLFQGHLDIRAEAEPELGSVWHSDNAHDYMRKDCSRTLNSLFGKVQVRRKGYSVGGTDSVFPQDASLNMSLDEYSDGLRRQIGSTVVYKSFEHATLDILVNTATSVPKRQVEDITKRLSQDFDDYYRSRQIDIHSQSDLLVLTCDAKGVVMREEDLRPVTQKAARSEKHKKQTRLSKGEKRNRKRMAMVASVYDISPFHRSAESILDKAKRPEGAIVPKPGYKRVWASLEKPPQEVIEDMFHEALRRDPKQERQWVILVDGQKAQLKQIKGIMKKQKINATIVLDFIHVLEYLWKAAYCFNNEESKEAEQWVKKRALNVLNGEAGQVAAGIRRSSTMRKLKTSQRKNANLCANYLLKKKEYLKYDFALTQGFPIATGVIEGACRYLIKDRMDITGARWRLEGAEAMLKMRAIVTGGDFEDYFSFHKEKERQRNYPFHDEIAHVMAA